MKQKRVEVIVEWQGNKAIHLPTGMQYITVAKFNEDWMQNAWSIILEFEQPPNRQGNPSRGYARFLMPNAPKNKLFSGVNFELYEGNKLTAKVIII